MNAETPKCDIQSYQHKGRQGYVLPHVSWSLITSVCSHWEHFRHSENFFNKTNTCMYSRSYKKRRAQESWGGRLEVYFLFISATLISYFYLLNTAVLQPQSDVVFWSINSPSISNFLPGVGSTQPHALRLNDCKDTLISCQFTYFHFFFSLLLWFQCSFTLQWLWCKNSLFSLVSLLLLFLTYFQTQNECRNDNALKWSVPDIFWFEIEAGDHFFALQSLIVMTVHTLYSWRRWKQTTWKLSE